MRGFRPRPSRGLAITVVGLLAALVLTACSGGKHGANAPSNRPSTASSSVGQSTGSASTTHFAQPREELFAPYDQAGHLQVADSKTAHGSCWTSSIAIPIAGVFRCMVNNQILDPCFAPAVETSPPTVSCFSDPWTSGIKVTLTGQLPTEDLILKNGDPWALELGNGAQCVLVTGALPELGSDVLEYRCGNGSVASLQTAADGTISALYGPSTGPLSPVAILVAWRGQSYRFG